AWSSRILSSREHRRLEIGNCKAYKRCLPSSIQKNTNSVVFLSRSARAFARSGPGSASLTPEHWGQFQPVGNLGKMTSPATVLLDAVYGNSNARVSGTGKAAFLRGNDLQNAHPARDPGVFTGCALWRRDCCGAWALPCVSGTGPPCRSIHHQCGWSERQR